MFPRLALASAPLFIIAAVLAFVIAAPATAQHNSLPPPATGITAVRTDIPGQALVSWQPVPAATHYRIAHVNVEDYSALVASGSPASWTRTVTFQDLRATDAVAADPGRLSFIVQHLQHDATHVFSVLTGSDATHATASVPGSFVWPDANWTPLAAPTNPAAQTPSTTDHAASSSTTPAVAHGQAPPTNNIAVVLGSQPGEVTVSWDAVPQATHYRIGYVNMEIDYHFAKASCTGEWIEAFVYVDVNARNITVSNGRAEYTVRRIDTGARHAFTVLTSNNFYNNRENVGADFSWPQNPRWKFLPGRADLPPGVTIPTPDCSAAPSASQPTPTVSPAPSPTPTTTAEPTPQAPSQQELADARQHMVNLINELRAEAGAPPVTLSENTAAQSHAEDMRDTCFISHWGSDGLKPYMRYSKAGGYHANSENASFAGACFGYSSYGETLEETVQGTVSGLYNSPGHRRTMLNPRYTKVSIGIAVAGAVQFPGDEIVYYRTPHAVVQQFATDNVVFDSLPTIADGRLTASGTVLLDRQPDDQSTHLLAWVYHHPPPHALTQRQLASSATYSHDRPVAEIEFSSPGEADALPPKPDKSEYYLYPDPYLADAGPPLTSDAEWHSLLQESSTQATKPRKRQVETYRIRDAVAHISGADFQITANIAPVLEEFGAGVYTVKLSAGNQTVFRARIAQYSIFYEADHP